MEETIQVCISEILFLVDRQNDITKISEVEKYNVTIGKLTVARVVFSFFDIVINKDYFEHRSLKSDH